MEWLGIVGLWFVRMNYIIIVYLEYNFLHKLYEDELRCAYPSIPINRILESHPLPRNHDSGSTHTIAS